MRITGTKQEIEKALEAIERGTECMNCDYFEECKDDAECNTCIKFLRSKIEVEVIEKI